MKIVIILGTHRTGTKSMAGYFGKYYDSVNSFHQYDSLRWVNIATNLKLGKIIGDKAFELFIRKIMTKHIEAHSDRDVYLLSNGFCIAAVSILQKYYNDVKIIHLIRDPRDFLTSYFNFIENRWQSKVANSFLPFWQPNGYLSGHFSFKEWSGLSKHEKYAWHWGFKNQMISNKYDHDHSKYLLLKLEDIERMDSRRTSIKRMVDFVDLKFLPESISYFDIKYNSSKKGKLDNWRHWNSAFCKKVNRFFSIPMKRYGYGSEVQWQSKING